MDINGFETLTNADQGLVGVLDNSSMSGLLADNGLLSVTKGNGLGSGLDLNSQELLDTSERIKLEEERWLLDEDPIISISSTQTPIALSTNNNTLDTDEITGISEDLSNGAGLTLDLPEFPTDLLEAKLQESVQSANTTANSVIPIFELKGVGVNNAKMTFIFDQNFLEDPNDPANQNFYLESNDPIHGERSATIDTGAGTMNRVRFLEGNESQADRLLFIGEADGLTVYGNFFLGSTNWGYVTTRSSEGTVIYDGDAEVNNPPLACDECGENENQQGTQTSPASIYAERGEFYQSQTDISISGRSGSDLHYSFTRQYRSRIDRDSPLGYNWDHEYFQRLEVQIDGSVLHDNGLSRNQDRYLLNDTGDGFISPPEFFTELKQLQDGSFELREANGIVKSFDSEGKLIEMRDRNDNFMSFLYNNQDQLIQVIDTLGRAIDYNYINSGTNAGRLDNIVDFSGRMVDFTYDGNGDLVEVTSPTVTGTPNGNDFVDGKTTRYTYTSGFSNEALNHNLLTITRPNEVANGGAAMVINEYGTSGFSFDKIISQTGGGVNDSGVEAGGTFNYEYTSLGSGLTGDPNQAISRTRETDRNGNVTEWEWNPLGYAVVKREFTKGLRNGEPEFFETRWEYNADGRLLRQINPEGDEQNYTYDESSNSRFAQGNLNAGEYLPDADRGGDQTEIQTFSLYEPIYQQTSLTVDPRGLDPNFTPPIPDPSGRSQMERYSTRYFFDYQEADAAVVLPLLAEELGVTEAEVQMLLDDAGIQLGLGDLNLDDVISTSIAGNVVAMVEPSVVLLEGSNQEVIEGDRLQDIFTLYRYNQFGQLTSTVDAEGNVDTFAYFAENDPDGDGTATLPPADGRILDNTTGGYLRETIEDQSHLIIDGHPPNNGSGAAPTAITMSYTYDEVGNTTSITDGRGIRTEFVVNELNQVVRTIRGAVVPGSSVDEPLPLTAFSYLEDVEYDANDNVVKRSIEDRGDTSNTGGFVDYTYTYDILDNLVTETQEVDINTTLVTQYRYDANENLTLTLSPEGNATTAQYDERDLLFVSTRGALITTDETLSAPAGFNSDPTQPYNVRGGIPCQCTTYNYDLNGNVIEMVDSDDTDLSILNNSTIAGIGDVTTYEYDGYNRRVATIDAVGNRTEVEYDPVGNIVAQRVYGPIGGISPIDNLGTNNVLLSEMVYLHDELNRTYQQDYSLFVANGVTTVRTPEIMDGSLTPDNNKVTTRFEYDRNSRQTFMIEDDEDTSRTDYDGADRAIKTIDPVGNTVEYAYDDNNNLIETKETDVAQVAGVGDQVFLTTYFYDSLNRLQQTTNNIGQTTFYRYDSRNNLVAIADSQGPVTGETINRRAFAEGALTVNAINDFGNVTRYFYDGISRKVREEQILTASGEGDGIHIGANIFGMKDVVGEEESFTPTADVTQGGGDGIIRTGYIYDDNSLLSAIVDDQGNATVYLYDNLNRQVTETKGLTVITPLDKALILGDREIVTPTAATINDPEVIAEELINNQLAEIQARLTDIAPLFPNLADQVDDNPPTTIVYGYSPDDNVLILEDENDSETFTKYDAINRSIATRIFRSGQSDDFTGDPIFAPDPVNDPSNPSTSFPAVVGTNHNNYEYDGLSRLTLATDNNDPDDPSDDSVVTYAYDSLSRVIEEVQQIGPPDLSSTSSGSNTANTLNDNTQTWIVDEWVGKLIRITDTTGKSQIREIIANTTNELTINRDWDVIPDATFTYEILPAKAISSGYTADTRTSVTYPNGRKLIYTYDGLDRIKSITDDGEALALVEYDYIGAGRVLERRSPTNGTRMTYLNDAGDTDIGYDGLRRIVTLRHLEADNSLIVGFEYGYDRMNNRTFQRKLHDLANSELYEYDSVYRLINFERGELNAPGDAIITPSTEVNQGQEWNLDGVGNWDESTIFDENGNPIVDDREHSSFNELITQEGATLLYDDNGNLVEDENYKYQYDFRNRLRIATRKGDGLIPDEVVAKYSYDAMGRRIRKEVSNSGANDGVTDFYYDGNQVVEERDGSNVLTQQFVYGNYIDEVLVMDRNLDGDDSAIGVADQRYHYHQDALSSVYAVTDENGDIAESYLYDPYGEVTVFDASGNIVADHPWGAANSLIDNPYLFTGRRYDEETGLYYYRARYYDADQGRFISRDPFNYVDGTNLYQYVKGQPIFYTDPSGRAITLASAVYVIGTFTISLLAGITANALGKVFDKMGSSLENNFPKNPQNEPGIGTSDVKTPCPTGNGSYTFRSNTWSGGGPGKTFAEIDINWEIKENGIWDFRVSWGNTRVGSSLGGIIQNQIYGSVVEISRRYKKNLCSCREETPVIKMEVGTATFIDQPWPSSNDYESCSEEIEITGISTKAKILKAKKCQTF
ncbi:RHS repeat-associated core domain-containing protein [Crocosphaera sp.]|uniref:RHS repeat-associated core domain-containing protein n=1 Tax=Crocosphaera sp. TaxID=2729996 RepID=UPI003F272FF8|nr:RHS repeat-associated core domain-containing protein [Crocosphaera sp.]